jgi:hypothetical protein
MAKTIVKYLCEACLREINPKQGILVKGTIRIISEGEEHHEVMTCETALLGGGRLSSYEVEGEEVAYCNICVRSILLGEDTILHRVRTKDGSN